MKNIELFKLSELNVVKRGDGVETTLLIGESNCEGTSFTSGLTRFPVGKKVPFHHHNCDEQVTILEGSAIVESDGKKTSLEPYDTSYVKAGTPHRFINTGENPLLILWIYNTRNVTRTFSDTGETVEHLSPSDIVS
ncbi:MAG: hypothetical protein CBC38_07655 [Gammaproteobacteria bacterium TMED78]|nr:MAG: hypothetical protein CBC38_07655 [Gammaproteobacteria bacterium TMED78]|tara:strand:+ start:844 stop:1251 length:408 start_codon:yes stop_codon:yes gene_type:complete